MTTPTATWNAPHRAKPVAFQADIHEMDKGEWDVPESLSTLEITTLLLAVGTIAYIISDLATRLFYSMGA